MILLLIREDEFMDRSRFSPYHFGRWIILIMILTLTFALLSGTAMAASHASSWEEVRDLFVSASATGKTEFRFSMSRDLLELYKADNSLLWYWAARGGVSDFQGSWSEAGDISIKRLKSFDCHYYTVDDESQFAAAVSEMRQQNAPRFVILAGNGLYSALKDSKAGQEKRLAAGLRSCDGIMSSDGVGSLEYYGCTYWYGGFTKAFSEAEVLSAMQRFGAEGYDAFAMSLDVPTWKSLSANSWARLNSIMARASLEAQMSYYEETYLLIWEREGCSVFYPGYEILRAVSQGTESQLPRRYAETLAAARGLISGVSGTPKEKALEIHNRLCEHVVYTVDESTDEDDRCIGAILNGRANCDGYADAYALLCGLERIPVVMQQGDDLNWEDPYDDAGHMWNLIMVDGAWRSTDVTWDDQEDGNISWVFWNIGVDRMQSRYTYEADLLPSEMLQVTDLLDRPVPEFKVAEGEQVSEAIRQVRIMGKDCLILWMTEELYREYMSEENPIWKWMSLGGMENAEVAYTERECRVEIRNAVWAAENDYAAEVGSEAELVGAIQAGASQGAGRITLYLTRELYDVFEKDGNAVWDWVRQAGFRNADVAYSGQGRRIIFENLR